jgi:hypothetical protein
MRLVGYKNQLPNLPKGLNYACVQYKSGLEKSGFFKKLGFSP